jgi:outer membrane autotransporter protein
VSTFGCGFSCGFATLCLFAAVLTILTAPASAQNAFRNTTAAELASDTAYILPSTGTYYLTPGHAAFEDTAFHNSGSASAPAVFVVGNGSRGATTFTAANITVSSTGLAGTAHRAFIISNYADAIVTSATITLESAATSSSDYALYLQTAGRFTGTDVLIAASGAVAHAIVVGNRLGVVLELNRATIQNDGRAAAIWFAGLGVTLLTSTTITTTGTNAPGIQVHGQRHTLAYNGGLVHASGPNAPALWLGTGNSDSGLGTGFTEFSGSFTNVHLLSDQGAGIDINTLLPGPAILNRPSLTGAHPGWAGNYALAFVSSTITGAQGSLRVTSFVQTSAATAEIYTHARLSLSDGSAMAGDVLVNDGARLDLALDASRLENTLRLTGSAPTANLTLANHSAIAGGIVLSGGAALDLSARDSAITGALVLTGSATARLRLETGATLDTVTLADHAAIDLTLTGGVLPSFDASGHATLNIIASAASSAAQATINLADAARLRITGKITHQGALNLSGSAPTLILANAAQDTLTLADGLTGSGLLLIEGLDASVLGQTTFRVIHDESATLAPGALELAAPVELGLAAYAIDPAPHPDGIYLTGGFGHGRLSSAAAAILDTPALAAADFLDALDPVLNHLSDLRAGLRAVGPDLASGRARDNATDTANRGATQGRAPSVIPRAQGDAGAFWLSARLGDTTSGGAAPGLAFRQTTAAITTGIDLRWGGGGAPALTTGLFADTSHATRDFDGAADGASTTFGAGAYALWRQPAGWHASAALRLDQTKNTLATRSAGNALDADYSVHSAGILLEAGWRLRDLLPAGWWLEPTLDAAFIRLGGDTYVTRSTNTANRLPVHLESINATRCRVRLAFGRELDEKWSLRARLAASRLDLSGGCITVWPAAGSDAPPVRDVGFLFEGWSAAASAGLIRRLGSAGHLTLDCETTFAADYKRPWQLTLSYSRAW